MLSSLGSTASRSPMPRPGMFPPSLNGRVVAVQVAPWFEERRMAPLFGSKLLVYMPTAAHTLFAFSGSGARLTTPFQPQLLSPTQSSSGVQELVDWFQR